ncbi:AsnC family transcriptional regulator [Aquabacterium sp. NJ1]|uniref:Lrp/AsnC family transcriptional regulator n=1 Tax=Aquabacterium sp. NJ1 TaxID=1538295 RepID=UPI00052C8543|nr:Lrp/AsnC family transcriptional regulator [Aquabacterium sp. NJ1]KGM40874.1 AsnC family transcriptional regulator [Aquabacterium sp. NJ1]
MNTPTPDLDETDIQLLSLLQQDASLSNQALADRLGLSPATCHRRVKRLKDEGYIEGQVAILSPQKMADALGWGLSALVEISLDVQTQEALDAFEQRALAEAEVQQCWRVSPGPDFILVVQVVDMPAYQALARRLFTQDSQVRNVRAFFAVKRAKFGTQWPLPPVSTAPGVKRAD